MADALPDSRVDERSVERDALPREGVDRDHEYAVTLSERSGERIRISVVRDGDLGVRQLGRPSGIADEQPHRHSA